ncbi:MAG: hypothetical protein GX640_14120 [Fibrobacter sp.]|nr:hypothetical protein [Fibrobacter sp.]
MVTRYYNSFVSIVLFCAVFFTTAESRTVVPSFLLKSRSQKNLVQTAEDHQWSINFQKSKADTINIIALRVEFQVDSSMLTTGNGLFGMRGAFRNSYDRKEYSYYTDNTYKYDLLPHDSLYFAHQLQAASEYFRKVSRNKLTIQYSIYPSGRGENAAYQVSRTMVDYSPGGKKKSETYDEYWERKSIGIMRFIQESILKAASDGENSPFANLRFEQSDSTIRDQFNRKTAILIFHAGASILTDIDGSQSDLIDVFITPEFFKYYRDSLGIQQNGISVQGKSALLINEVMMCSETANQDSTNWGIQSILVNQIARQLGIPDLTTSNGAPGIGGFCIMDAGLFGGNGFISPYPSAWVRAFMGWDTPVTIPLGKVSSCNVKALTSVLDNQTNRTTDTTIVLVPINDHEYYLIENRQRNLSGNKDLFKYDSTMETGKSIGLASWPINVNIDKNVVSSTGKNSSNVISEVVNNDISIPASGVLVWHVDEKLIRERLPYNFVNIDSTYKGVNLVEADGIADLGIEFYNAMSQSVYDVGGSEDVFPHITRINDSATVTVNGFGPYTRPSTRSNDGGQTWLKLEFKPYSSNPRKEYYYRMRGSKEHFVTNFSDSVFTVSVQWDYLSQSWPKRAAPEQFFEPVVSNLDKSNPDKELFLLGKSGRFYAWSTDTTISYNKKRFTVDNVTLLNDTIKDADTLACIDSLKNVVSMPSVVDDKIFIPTSTGNIIVLSSLSSTEAVFDTIKAGTALSTYVCNYQDSSWAVGCKNGQILFGSKLDKKSFHKLPSKSKVTALATIREDKDRIVAIQDDGTLSLCLASEDSSKSSIKIKGIGPYVLVTGDLDRDSSSEIVVADSRHGLWVFKKDLSIAHGWTEKPNDDATSYYTYIDTTVYKTNDRRPLAEIFSAPALADIDRDGYLDILIGGTNGVYAFNYKGSFLNKWPAYLDKHYWFQRGSVTSSPVVVTGPTKEPLVLFSSLTGDRVTYYATKIIKADKQRGKVWFNNEENRLDSLWDLSPGYIDTILTMGDSLAFPYNVPGGIVDAVGADAKRPSALIASTLQSSWPLTAGSSLSSSPLLCFLDNDRVPDLISVSKSGWVYRWEIEKAILPDSLFWPMTGYDNGRSFAYGGNIVPVITVEKEPVTFFSYPNPTRGLKKVRMKYKFSGPASDVKLDIFSQTGFKVYSHSKMGNPPIDLTGSFPSWNELEVSVEKFGPGVYRCRLEATINGKKQVKYWKMAVVK